MEVAGESHRRYNALTEEWILCSPQRALRPWLGQTESAVDAGESVGAYDAECYLCPTNTRKALHEGMVAQINPNYKSVFVFENDFPALVRAERDDTRKRKQMDLSEDELFGVQQVTGRCFVVCFSPNHGLTMALLPKSQAVAIVLEWTNQFKQLRQDKTIVYVQVFENRGAAMGCSNPHPHCQIWCTSFIPQQVSRELTACKNYAAKHTGCCLLCDYLAQELQEQRGGVRIVYSNDAFVVVVPWWALWPFETLVLPRRHVQSLLDLSATEAELLADILQALTCKYDNMFKTSFPYSMGIHQAPTDNNDYQFYHMHLHFYPPLLRSASVKKFMVGFEMLAEPQRDLTAEQAASRLQQCDGLHHYAQATSNSN